MNYGKKKTAQREKPTQYRKVLFNIHNPYTQDVLESRKWYGDYYQFISIDPAIENFGFRIEKRYKNGDIIGEVLCKTKFTHNEKVNGKNKKINVDQETLENIVIRECTDFLDKYDDYYDDIHFILIEQQMIENWYSTRVMQHVITYFSMLYRSGKRGKVPVIVEVNSKLKGYQLGYTRRSGLTVKEWAVIRAKEILEVRDDKFSLDVWNKVGKKKDDVSDVVIQIEAFCRYIDLPPFTEDKYTHEHNKEIGCGITPATEIALANIELYKNKKKLKLKRKIRDNNEDSVISDKKEGVTVGNVIGTSIGGVAGGIIGEGVAGPPGLAAGTAIGSVAGAAVGECAPEILDKTGDVIEHALKEMGENIDDVLDKLGEMMDRKI